MPSKKTKINARFPPARIKKIMQTDDEIGKVAAPVPVLISKALELFVDSLLTKASKQTHAKQAKTLTTSHIKQCIHKEKTFDFLKDLVENVPDLDNDVGENKNNISAIDSNKKERHRKSRGRKRKQEEPLDEEEVEDNTSSDEDDSEESRDDSSMFQDQSLSQDSISVQYQSGSSSSNTQEPTATYSSEPSTTPWSSTTTLPLPPYNMSSRNADVAGAMSFCRSSRSREEDEEDYDA